MYNNWMVIAAIELFSQYGYSQVEAREIRALAAILAGSSNSNVAGEVSREEILKEIIDEIPNILRFQLPDKEQVAGWLSARSPADLLTSFVCPCRAKSDKLAREFMRFVLLEYYNLVDLREAVNHYFIVEPARTLQWALDKMMENDLIPPCDTWALSQIWFRTNFVFHFHFGERYRDEEYEALYRMLGDMITGELPTPAAAPIYALPDFAQTEEMSSGNHLFNSVMDLLEKQGYEQTTLEQMLEGAGAAAAERYEKKAEVIQEFCSELLDERCWFQPAAVDMSANMDKHWLQSTIQRCLYFDAAIIRTGFVRLYRVLSREYSFLPILKDYLDQSVYRSQYALSHMLAKLKPNMPAEDARSVATAIIFTKQSMMQELLLQTESDYPRVFHVFAQMTAPLFQLIVSDHDNQEPKEKGVCDRIYANAKG